MLLGSIMSTLGSRVTSFGLADLRGGLHAGFDEGAWITTSFGVGQMLVGVASPYLGAIFGVRRVLLLGIVLFFIASLLGPLSPNLGAFLAMQFLGGVGSGTFIPLTISFIVRSLPARLVDLRHRRLRDEFRAVAERRGLAGRLVLGQLSWQWIDWQYCVALPLMFACIWYGVPREKINTRCCATSTGRASSMPAIGFGLLYAGLDQGNRLDWTNNGLVNGLLLSGGAADARVRRARIRTPRPFLNLRLLARETC